MSPAEKEAREMMADRKASKAAGKAYDAALTNTEAAPAARKVPQMAPAAPKRAPMVDEAIQEMRDAKDRKKISDMGYKKGGSVSASKRADGCAQRGKTRGKMV